MSIDYEAAAKELAQLSFGKDVGELEMVLLRVDSKRIVDAALGGDHLQAIKDASDTRIRWCFTHKTDVFLVLSPWCKEGTTKSPCDVAEAVLVRATLLDALTEENTI